MSLRFIYGRAGSGKSFACRSEIADALKDNRNERLILLVPEQYTLQAERNLIQTIGKEGIIRAEVLSFRRMAYRVFSEVGGITRQYIQPAGKCMLLYRIMHQIKDKLKVFSNAARQQGFVNTLAGTFTEFKRYYVTPELLMHTGEGIEGDELLKNKLEDIRMIFEAFEKIMHEKYLDSDDDLTMLADKLPLSRQLDGAQIWIDEFSGFTPQEYRVIEELLKKAKRVSICFCTDCLMEEYQPDVDEIFSPVKNAVRKLMALAKDHHIPVEKPKAFTGHPCFRFKDNEELGHLERYFFSFPYRTYKEKTKNIGLFTAMNIYTEIENTARDIVSLCRDRGIRYKDIAVVTRNLADYEKLISVIFDQYDIPYFIDSKKDIVSHPFVLLVLSCLDIFVRNWSYESVFRYLKTGLTNIETHDIDIIENYVLATGIRGNRWTKEEEWDFPISSNAPQERSEYEKQLLDQVNDIRKRITSPLIRFRSKTKGRKTVREICAALYEFLCDIGVPGRIEQRIETLKDAGELDLANQYGQIWNIMMGVLDQMVEVLGDDMLTVERFKELLAIGVAEYQVGLIPPALDQVMVGSVERSKSHDIKALYILGVNDGVFPAVEKDEGILSDKDRETLRSLGVELAPDTRTKAFEEQYLIYKTLTSVSGYLRLSYPIADLEGGAMRPSVIISRLKKVFAGIYEQSNIAVNNTVADNMQMIGAAMPTFHELITKIRCQVEGESIHPLWWDVYRWYRCNDQWRHPCKTALSGLFYTNQVNTVPAEKIKNLYGSPAYTSISRMEQFASCPFSYYVKYGLKAEERKVFKLSAPDLGTFMHTVLEEFSKKMAQGDIRWEQVTKEWCTEIISTIIDDLLKKMSRSIFNSSQRYQYIAGRLKRVLSRAVWLIVQHIQRSGFEPIGYEMSFQEKGDFPPITIALPSGEEIKLVGRIDRIDGLKTEEGTYLRIIDYKSGSKAFKLCDVYYGLQIQLITYLDALWEHGGKKLPKPILPGGILYFRLDDPIVKAGASATEEQIEREIMKQLKMKGLLLADVKLIKEMDRNIQGDSLIIPARLNKGDTLGKSSSVATAQQFEILRKHVRKLLTKLGEEMLKGDVSIKPYKKKKFTSCTYCEYASVCQFDPGLKDNEYRVLSDLKDEDVWKVMEE